jgi:hypothetical protein
LELGSNENVDGLVQQYLSKCTDLSVCSKEELDAVADEFNIPPCKFLGGTVAAADRGVPPIFGWPPEEPIKQTEELTCRSPFHNIS